MPVKPIAAAIVAALLIAGRAYAVEPQERTVIIERADGALTIADSTRRTALSRVTGLGDLSHATVVFSHDLESAFVFGRDGGLSKVALDTGTIVKRIVQAGNSIGGALSDDGTLVAVGNYSPGGIKIFRSDTLDEVVEIPAAYGPTAGTDGGTRSKVVGVVAAPHRRFVFTLYDAGEIWVADLSDISKPRVTKFTGIGRLPYDGNITPDGRFYVAGLFGEDGLALLDLEHPEAGVKRILDGYGRGEEPLPVYKMPHLEGWGVAGGELMLPAVGHHELLVVDRTTWRETARIAVHGQPVFAVASPDGKRVWVNFAHPLNDVVQVIDVASRAVIATIEPGKAVMHVEFSPDGGQVWLSARDSDRVAIYDAASFAPLGEIPAHSPSGIFMAPRGRHAGS